MNRANPLISSAILSERYEPENYVGLQRTSPHPSVMSSMLQCLQDEEVDRYYNESVIVGNLMDTISNSTRVRDRWLPQFSPPIAGVDELLNSRSF